MSALLLPLLLLFLPFSCFLLLLRRRIRLGRIAIETHIHSLLFICAISVSPSVSTPSTRRSSDRLIIHAIVPLLTRMSTRLLLLFLPLALTGIVAIIHALLTRSFPHHEFLGLLILFVAIPFW